MLEFLINDLWHMIFCKFDQSISIFPYEKAVGHRLIVASALKELTNMAAMLDFVLISTFYLKNWWWKYILDSMALKKKFQQHDDYGMYVIFWGGGALHIMVAILDLWGIVEYSFFFGKNDVIWCYITLNYRYVGFMLINSI